MVDLLLCKAYVAHACESQLMTLTIINSINRVSLGLTLKHAVIGRVGRCQAVFITYLLRCESLIEDVERPLMVLH